VEGCRRDDKTTKTTTSKQSGEEKLESEWMERVKKEQREDEAFDFILKQQPPTEKWQQYCVETGQFRIIDDVLYFSGVDQKSLRMRFRRL